MSKNSGVGDKAEAGGEMNILGVTLLVLSIMLFGILFSAWIGACLGVAVKTFTNVMEEK